MAGRDMAVYIDMTEHVIKLFTAHAYNVTRHAEKTNAWDVMQRLTNSPLDLETKTDEPEEDLETTYELPDNIKLVTERDYTFAADSCEEIVRTSTRCSPTLRSTSRRRWPNHMKRLLPTVT